jgi:transposase
MKQTIVYIGIDVAKAHLDVAWQKRLRCFDNDKAGRATLVQWIKQKQSGPVQVICEASGGYEQDLLEVLAQAALAVSLVQATRVRQYARAAGILAKTDVCWLALEQRCSQSPRRRDRLRRSFYANWNRNVGT